MFISYTVYLRQTRIHVNLKQFSEVLSFVCNEFLANWCLALKR